MILRISISGFATKFQYTRCNLSKWKEMQTITEKALSLKNKKDRTLISGLVCIETKETPRKYVYKCDWGWNSRTIHIFKVSLYNK